MYRRPDDARNVPEHGADFFRDVQLEFLIHELKDPIAVIDAAVHSILHRRDKFGPLSPRQERALTRALRNTKKTRDMLYNLLEIGRSEAGRFICCRFRPVEAVRESLMDALEIMAAPIHQQAVVCETDTETLACLQENGIIVEMAPGLETIEIDQDEVKFRQILGNLIKNAIQHRKTSVTVKLAAANDHITVEVADDGPGIDPEHHDLIFQRYAQVSDTACRMVARKGHGLGLAGARILARCLGGDIRIRSRKGIGAAFFLTLPVEMADGSHPYNTDAMTQNI